ncbi:tetratricopeptide repeat-containing S1 family peptidase, partial [Sphaerospermopsis reniformis]|uniref:tetratricopeptide repeat-containing S1 family peptidase n=1 Tax=Sphaerospermopsis reniformis TaxID=531300 RepID=UPI001F37F153
MKLPQNLYKLSHLFLFFFLLFPASPIIITGCSSSLFARKPGTLSESELKNVLKEITVKVIVDDRETASGTIIKKQNGFYTVLTNAHVIENAKSVKVVTIDNKIHDVEFSKLDRQENQKDDLYDLARLTFSSETTYLVAGLGEENIKPGEKVFAGGYVKGNLQTTTGTAKLFLNQPLIKGQQIAYNNDIQQGMSGGAIINENGYLVGINSKLANPVLQTDFRYLQGEQPDEKTLKEWGNYSWGIAVNLVDEAAPDLALFPERVIRKIGGIPAKVLDIAKLSSVQIKKADGGIGSGVIIAKDKDIYYVLTAAHVVENKQEYQVVAPDKQVYKVDNQTIRTRKGLDMAVLQFRSSQVYQVATLGDYELKGQFVFLYGWKGEELNHPSWFSVGVMLNADGREFWSKQRGYELAYTNEGYPGMSGGGIWDTEGKLVGIHNFAETEVFGYSLGLSVESFLFYQKDGLWKLPQRQLNVAKNEPNEPKSADVNPLVLATVPTASVPDSVNDTGKQWLTYGIQLSRIGATNNAIKAMENAVRKDPNSWEAHYNVAWIGLIQEKDDLALNVINIAIRNQPSFYRSYLLKGMILQKLKKYENAVEALNLAILKAEKKDKEKDFLLYQLRGELFDELKRHQEAIADYTQAITINPQYALAYYNRGVVKSDLGDKKGAIADYTQAITINPQYVSAYYNRGVVKSDLGDKKGAIADFTQAITINPQLARAYVNRGIAKAQLGDAAGAIADFTQAIIINPQDPDAYNNRGFVKSDLGDKAGAIADYTQAITINPQDPDAYNNRGNAKSDLGDKAGAIADYTQAITINPQ